MWAAIALACVAAGCVVRWRVRPPTSLPERALAILAVPGVMVAAAVAFDAIATAPHQIWNDIRLAPSAALLRGYALYYLPGDGPILGHIYGPIAPLFYLPAVMLPTPSAAMRAGVALTLLTFLLPMVLFAWVWRTAGPALSVGAVLVFTLYGMQSDALYSVVAGIHADTPAVAFAALACLPLLDSTRRLHTGWLSASALAVVLAVGSKQVALPVAFALPAYLWLADGRAAALRYVRVLVYWCLGAAAVLVAFFDLQAMWFQALTAPASHSWRFDDGPRAFVQTLRDFVPRAFVPAAVVIAAAFMHGRRERGWAGLRTWARDNPWSVLVVVAAFSVPTSILGRMKIGGTYAAFSFSIYPLALAGLLAVLHAAARASPGSQAALRRLPALILLAALTATTWRAAALVRPPGEVLDAVHADPEAAAYAFVRRHPGEVYLPFNPLIKLMAEDRVYNVLIPAFSLPFFGRGAGRDVGRSPADDQAFTRHVPPNMRYVLYPVEPGTEVTPLGRGPDPELHIRRYLPRFTSAVPVAPGWAALVAD